MIPRSWVEREPCCIAEDAIVDVGVFHNGAGIMPFAIQN